MAPKPPVPYGYPGYQPNDQELGLAPKELVNDSLGNFLQSLTGLPALGDFLRHPSLRGGLVAASALPIGPGGPLKALLGKRLGAELVDYNLAKRIGTSDLVFREGNKFETNLGGKKFYGRPKDLFNHAMGPMTKNPRLGLEQARLAAIRKIEDRQMEQAANELGLMNQVADAIKPAVDREHKIMGGAMNSDFEAAKTQDKLFRRRITPPGAAPGHPGIARPSVSGQPLPEWGNPGLLPFMRMKIAARIPEHGINTSPEFSTVKGVADPRAALAKLISRRGQVPPLPKGLYNHRN